MRSSYKDNNYADFFTALVKIYKPTLVVECGILDGYSLVAMAKGLPENGKIIGIDLFENYEFNRPDKDSIEKLIKQENLENKIKLIKANATRINKFDSENRFADKSIDILHIDISNDGEILEAIEQHWYSKIKQHGLLIFEGGSEARDEIDWMCKYDKKPIRKFKNSLKNFEFITLTPFPSITLCRKL